MISDLGRSAEDRQNGVADEFDDHTVEAFDAGGRCVAAFWVAGEFCFRALEAEGFTDIKIYIDLYKSI